MLEGSIVHLLAGGLGGMFGAVVTSPLEVVKTRLQSSSSVAAGLPQQSLHGNPHPVFVHNVNGLPPSAPTSTNVHLGKKNHNFAKMDATPERMSILKYLRTISKTEGYGALFKGLGPNLIGVLPSRSIYFSTYKMGQNFFSQYFEPGSHAIFCCSSALGGFVSSTATNPIWYVKTRLQLDKSPCGKTLTVGEVIRDTWKKRGVKGFYRGVQASYAGVSETVINFVMYEHIKASILEWRHVIVTDSDDDEAVIGGRLPMQGMQTGTDMIVVMAAAICSKAFATTVAYPHEVVRTRLREDGERYRGFFQTLRCVVMDDGVGALYRGLTAHYLRQIPNSCIMMATYEVCLFLMQDD